MQKQLGPISRFDTIPACKLIQTLRHSTYMRYAYVLHRRRAVKCVGLLSTEYARVLDAVQGKLGVLQLSLCYQPASETITIVIMKARDLKAKDINGLSGNTQLKRTQTHTHTHTHTKRHTWTRHAVDCQNDKAACCKEPNAIAPNLAQRFVSKTLLASTEEKWTQLASSLARVGEFHR